MPSDLTDAKWDHGDTDGEIFHIVTNGVGGTSVMKGFKDSSKTCYFKGGYAKGGSTKGAAKISQVMHEFKSGELHSGSKKGPSVTNPKQAVAIALSQARKSEANIPAKKAHGGAMAPAHRNMSQEGTSFGSLAAQLDKMRQTQRQQEKTMQSAKRGVVVNVKPSVTSPTPFKKGGVTLQIGRAHV